MSLDLLQKISQTSKEKENLPNWVSKQNLTYQAVTCIDTFFKQRSLYISKNHLVSAFKNKKSYQISASEVARKVGASTPTLISTSAYSKDLKSYLDNINAKLLDEKNQKLEKRLKLLSSGNKQGKKDVILKELQNAKLELEELKKINAKIQIQEIINGLSLPIKQKLGL